MGADERRCRTRSADLRDTNGHRWEEPAGAGLPAEMFGGVAIDRDRWELAGQPLWHGGGRQRPSVCERVFPGVPSPPLQARALRTAGD